MAPTLTNSITKEQVLKNIAGMQQPTQPTTPQVGGAVLADGTITQNGTTAIPTNALAGAPKLTVPQVKSTDAQSNLAVRVAPSTPETLVPEKSSSQTIADQMKSILGEQGKQAEFTQAAQDEAGLAQKRLDMQAIDKEAANTTLKYNAQIEEAKKNLGGMYGGQAQSNIDQLESKKNQELANIAIRKSVAQGDVNTALALVKDKVDAKFEPLKNQIDTLKAQYSMVQNDMSESEKMKAEKEIRKQERAFDLQVKQMESLEKFKLAALDKGITITADNMSDAVKQLSTASGQKVTPEALTNKVLADEILAGDFKGLSGIKNPLRFVPGTDIQITKNKLNQLGSILSLDSRQKLKGSGAISDFEAKTLANAASALGFNNKGEYKGNLSDAALEQELKNIRGVFTTAAGLDANVMIIDPLDPSNPKIGKASRNMIDNAIASGYQVIFQ